MSAIVTVLSRSRLPQLRVLVDTARAAGHEGRILAALVDDPLGEVMLPRECQRLPLTEAPTGVAHALRLLCPDADALARALTPWVLRHDPLEEQIVVSPSTWVGAPLELSARSIGLVPRWSGTVGPPAGAAVGGFQETIIVLGREPSPFLPSWRQRTLERASGLIVGAVLDEVAAVVPIAVIHDIGVGVDAWNAGARRVFGDGAGRFRVDDGRLLVTYHFDGFDIRRPHLAVRPAPGERPAVDLSAEPGLRALYRSYTADVVAATRALHDDFSGYAFATLPGGLPLDAAIRRAFADNYRRFLLKTAPEPPDPFVDGGLSRFVEWLNEPIEGGTFTRYVESLHRTWPGLDGVFPDIHGRDRGAFVDWLHRYGRTDGPIASAIDLPARRRPRPAGQPPPRRQGVNVAGYLDADSGLGVAANRILLALDAAAVPTKRITYRRTLNRQTASVALTSPEACQEAPFDVSVVCVTAEQFPFFREDMGPEFFADVRTIGYWYWELESFPDGQERAFDLVDEVWVATEHVRRSVAARTTKPVVHMPIPLLTPMPSDRDRRSFGLPDGYLFLFTFDFNSIVERKNPLGLIAAFTSAFPTPSGTHLVIKTINAGRWPTEAEELRAVIADRPDIELRDGYLSGADQAALVAAADCYVSLHRAEGLGLTLADAMALGKPVIATRYSGNLDFMDDTNSLLVPFRYVAVPAGVPAYPEGAPWAEPDVEVAAAMMRRLVADPASGVRLGERAARDISERWGPLAMGRRMQARLEEVWNSALPRA